MDSLGQDLRAALRLLTKHPGLATVAILTAAVGIAATTAAFSLVNGVLLRPLPFDDPENLVQVFRELPSGDRTIPIASSDFTNWTQGAASLEMLGAFNSQDFEVAFDPSAETQQLAGAQVSADFFATLGLQPLTGRTFTAAEAAASEPVVVLGHSLWTSRYAADTGVVGRSLWIGGRPHTIVGVLGPDIEYPLTDEFFVPRDFNPRQVTNVGGRREVRMMVTMLSVVARLRPGATPEQVAEELEDLSAGSRMRMIAGQNARLAVRPLAEHIIGRFRVGLWLVAGAVGFLMLVACANVANLLLSRAVERKREAALRLALGAGRGRLIRQLLTESLVLALIAGVAGIVLARWGIQLLLSASPVEIPRAANVEIDLAVLGFATAAAVVTGVLFGLAPALEGTRQDLAQSLKSSVTESGGGLRMVRGNRMRLALVTAEVAFCLVLLVGAGLLATSFLRLLTLDPGFNPRNLLLVQARIDFSGRVNPAAIAGSYDQLLEGLRSLPGIQAAATASAAPPTETLQRAPFSLAGQSYADDGDRPTALQMQVSDGYFETLSTPVLRGRGFVEADLNGPRVAVINQSALALLGGDAMGRQVIVQEEAHEIVGVVADVYQAGPQSDPEPTLYTPARSGMIQMGSGNNVRVMMRSMTVLVRTTADPFEMTAGIQREVEAAGMTLRGVQSIESSMWQSVAQPRFYAGLFGVFAMTGLVLAAVGIFAVISYAVSQSSREIGIRMALGADRGRIIATVLRQGLTITIAGIAIGLVAALVLTRFMESLLVRVTPTDPATLAGVTVLFIVVAAVAAYLPARRATTVDPMRALRYE